MKVETWITVFVHKIRTRCKEAKTTTKPTCLLSFPPFIRYICELWGIVENAVAILPGLFRSIYFFLLYKWSVLAECNHCRIFLNFNNVVDFQVCRCWSLNMNVEKYKVFLEKEKKGCPNLRIRLLKNHFSSLKNKSWKSAKKCRRWIWL